MAQITVNSIRNKFESLVTGFQNKVDILLISETKLDETFPTTQFSFEGFTSPYRLDRNDFGELTLNTKVNQNRTLKQGGFIYRNKLKKQKMDCWMFLQPS